METFGAKRFIPIGFELGTTLSSPNRSITPNNSVSPNQIYFPLAHNFIVRAFHGLRRGEVEAKPTLVALSSGSGKRSSMGESDGLSEYDNSTSYEDTDGDTDGERLVTDSPGSSPGKADDVCSHVTCL